MGGTECAHNPLALEGIAELVDVIRPLRGGGVGGRHGGGRLGLEELFDAAVLVEGEGGELGIIGGDLGKDYFSLVAAITMLSMWLSSLSSMEFWPAWRQE